MFSGFVTIHIAFNVFSNKVVHVASTLFFELISVQLLAILASTYGPGPYGPGPLILNGPGPYNINAPGPYTVMVQDHMVLDHKSRPKSPKSVHHQKCLEARMTTYQLHRGKTSLLFFRTQWYRT